MKILSWNVNGLRACEKKGFLDWFEKERADIVCLQEIKARPEQLEEKLRHPLKYHSIWNPAEKPGYSGTVIYSKKEPLEVRLGLGVPEFDREGRVMIVKYPTFTLVNSYFPNSQRDHARLPYKLKFCRRFLKVINELRGQGENLVMCADWNIAPTELDLKNPKSNQNNAGFLPEERAWMDQLIAVGYFDSFRHFHSEGGCYTWWSYRPGVRERNIGWRLDYFMMNEEHKSRLKKSYHRSLVYGSDHCPVGIELKK
ncbi:MAG: exodeoxyribonuclease III [Bdellovibrionales bacterium]|nr:exodeoxyribonuclease III [Bdellovibrionales bacterium]